MIQKERQDDDVEEKEDGKQEGDSQDGGSTGIHKYFGKSNKSPKFLTLKTKKNIKLPNSQVTHSLTQNISFLTETNITSQKQISNFPNKTKLKCQYRWNSDFLDTKPKLKLTLNPFVGNKLFEEVLLNWKSVLSKYEDENFDFKFNQKKQLNIKYKRTKFFFDKKHRHKFQMETTIEPDLYFKNSISFQSLFKSPLFENYKYLNSGEVKCKTGIRDYSYRTGTCSYKFDFSQKLTFLINKYKAKQQTKINLTFGQKQSAELKSNLEVTNDKNTWTLYGSVFGYKWGVAFDQVKFLYSLYDNWKIGCMYGQKNTWEVILQNPKLNKSLCSSIALHVGSKNTALILKNKWSKKQLGRLNFQLSIQNPLKNTRFDKINYGFVINMNL